MTKNLFSKFALCGLLLAALAPVACQSIDSELNEVTAEHIARPAFMVERKLSAGGMEFQLWERMHQRGEPVNTYIEGDGHTKARNAVMSGDPSPGNPVALNLASRDKSENLLYISRPCQYMAQPDEKACSSKLWGERRYSPEVLNAYNEALDEVKKRYELTDINLIGYDGGANIAVALAASRSDVVSLRTVAGILNPTMVYAQTKEPLDSDSILAPDIASKIATVPQHHFIGAGDTYVQSGVYHTFRQAMGDSECVHYTFVPDADHEAGWVEKWPELLKATVACPQEQDPNLQPYQPTTPLPPVPTVLEKP